MNICDFIEARFHVGKCGCDFDPGVGWNNGSNAGHDLLQSSAALLHCIGSISEDEMRRIVTESIV
jgi:hypothetical protein